MLSVQPFLLLTLLLSSCATASGEFAPLGANHPANPRAPEAPVTDPSALLRADARDAAADVTIPERGADAGSPSRGAFVCPMHADVSSDQPGRCPKCGMALVAREHAQPESEEKSDES